MNIMYYMPIVHTIDENRPFSCVPYLLMLQHSPLPSATILSSELTLQPFKRVIASSFPIEMPIPFISASDQSITMPNIKCLS